MYEVIFTETSKKQFENLNSNVQIEIRNKLKKVSLNPEKELLKLKKSKYYYVRISAYRVIIDWIENELIIDVIKIGHRAIIYKEMGI
ncbi:MAG: mRNA interferase RelE/StbE [Patescibacteria group bacterium]|jgi:mRNA interferase RelE/StbE